MTERDPRRAREIDIHLGRLLRARRLEQHMSQSQLADALGVTFQQIQKYEKGINRISAGRLFEIANLLGVPITFFFEGSPQPRPRKRPRRS